MNTSEIISIIEEYVQDQEDNYAIMIDGPWGSGKTYLYTNKLLDVINNLESGRGKPRINIYVSLYGICSIEALSRQILTAYTINSKAHWKGSYRKAFKIFHGIVGIVSRAVTFSVGPFSINSNKIFKGLYHLLKKNDMFICFDDFERCTIPLNELLGFVNNLVEHCNCKVIILADENNIGRIYANTNLEAKYQTVLMGKTLLSDNKSRENKNIDRQSQTQNNISIKEVKELNEKLYSENFLYKDVKEKVIGRTIYYYPDMKEVITEIVSEKYKDSNNIYRVFLENNINAIVSQFVSKGNRNLRIVKKWVKKFYRIFESANKYFPKESNVFYEEMLDDFMQYSIWVVCAEEMNKKLLQSSSSSSEEYVFFEGHEYTHIIRYGFIDAWIIRRVWDDGDFCKVCKNVIKRKERESINNPKRRVSQGKALGSLCSWMYQRDKEVEQTIKELIEEVDQGLYEFRDFGKIIANLQFFSQMGFKGFDLNNVQSIMIRLIQNYSEIQEDDDFLALSFDTEERKKVFDEIYNPIKDAMNKQGKKIGKSKPEEEKAYLSGDNFLEFCRKFESYFISHRTFMEYIDINSLVDLINSCDIESLYKIRDGIKYVYHMSNVKEFYITDLEKLSNFYTILCNDESVNCDDSITRKYAISNLRNFIKEVLTYLGAELEE